MFFQKATTGHASLTQENKQSGKQDSGNREFNTEEKRRTPLFRGNCGRTAMKLI